VFNNSNSESRLLIPGIIVITIFIIAGTVVAALYLRKQLLHTEERKLLIQARMTGIDVPEIEVLSHDLQALSLLILGVCQKCFFPPDPNPDS